MQPPFEVLTIRAPGGATAVIVPELGGIVSSLELPWAGALHETLFQHAFFWERDTPRTRGGIPFIFPICGRLERDGQPGTYLYDGRRYTLPIHGFASRMPWRVQNADHASRLVLSLTDTAQTRATYPFAFTLTLAYQIEDDGLRCEQTYTNHSDMPMPFYAGFHPYFLTPEPGHGKDDVQLSCDVLRALAYNQRLTDIAGVRPLPPLPASIGAPAVNDLLTMPAPGTGATLAFPDGHTLALRAGGIERPALFAYLQFYTMPDQPFFCMEPWMGHPNALNAVTGAHWLQPGETTHGVLDVRVTG